MKIGIIGAGAVGSLFADSLARAGGNEVTCAVRRQAQADDINNNGIRIQDAPGVLSVENSWMEWDLRRVEAADRETEPGSDGGQTAASGTLRALAEPESEEVMDLVLVAVKSVVTEEAVLEHRRMIGPDTMVMSLQNGYGNHRGLLKVTDGGHVLIGTTAQAANIREDGTVIHAGNGATVIGMLDAVDTGEERADEIADTLRAAGFQVRVTEDAEDAVFRKLFINIGINALCALADCRNGDLLRDGQLLSESKGLVFEAVQVVNDACGRHYDGDEIWNAVYGTIVKTAQNYCSMVQDVRKGRRTEIRSINGAIVTLADEGGLEAPLNLMIVQEIEAAFGA